MSATIVRPGSYRLRVEHPRFATVEACVEVRAGRSSVVRVDLAPRAR